MKYKKIFLTTTIVFFNTIIYPDALTDQMIAKTQKLATTRNALSLFFPTPPATNQNDTVIPDTSGTNINPVIDRSSIYATAYKKAVQLKAVSDTNNAQTLAQNQQGIARAKAITLKAITDTANANTTAQTQQGITRTKAINVKAIDDTTNANKLAQTQYGIARTKATQLKAAADLSTKTATDKATTDTNNATKNANLAAIKSKAINDYTIQKAAADKASAQAATDLAKADPKTNARIKAIKVKAARQ